MSEPNEKLRDRIASSALAALIIDNGAYNRKYADDEFWDQSDIKDLAIDAYRYADAMLRARDDMSR